MGLGTDQATEGYVIFQAAVLRALPHNIDLDVAFGWTQDRDELARVLREALTPNGKTASCVYPISVNYEMGVEDAVKLGCYYWANPIINSSDFQTKCSGEAEVTVVLIHFDYLISSNDTVLRELDRMGYRPAELHELLAFGEKYPEKQQKFDIVALASVWRDRNGCGHVPCLRMRDDLSRDLDICWVGGGWGVTTRFAAVRKQA